MLYSSNAKREMDKELFRNPTSEYRGAPFWAWNCKLNKEVLLKQIEQLKSMGMGGFHIHCRTGMATEYLGDEFMDMVKACNEKAKELQMLCWLYDEDRWPSGAAGGLVTKEEKYRARFLVFTPKPYDKDAEINSREYTSSGRAQHSKQRYLLARYEVVLRDGYLEHYKRLSDGEKPSPDSKVWWAYLEVTGTSPWFNNQAYVNTLDEQAIKKFIEITHERYYMELAEDFGKSVPAIFTDEPQFTHKENLGYAYEEREINLPFTDDFDETYKRTYVDSILDYLPELIWELPNGEVSAARYRYHDHLAERFASAYADNIGSWCKAHGIMLTGHMMDEPTLFSQTRSLGEAMRSYRSFQLPGIDMLCDWREYTTAKQAQSASRQFGCPGVLSELYGVTNWDFDFRGHKLAGDWQAALGVTVRVHHLAWVSMEGEAKRDYPASIGYQSPWYKEYPLIEDYFSRLNTVLTRGKARVRVGVIHPIESYWLHFGPEEQTALVREEMENNFRNITEWLLFGLIDFDFISEALLPDQSPVLEAAAMKVGEMEYEVIIVPACETLRSTTVERLEAFEKAGGRVIFMGQVPSLVDAARSDKSMQLAEKCICIPFTKAGILKALEAYREVEIRRKNGCPTEDLFYQLREDGDKRWLFICHAKKPYNPDIATTEQIDIRIKGKWKAEIYDALTGSTDTCPYEIIGEETRINHKFSQHASLLLCLETAEKGCAGKEPVRVQRKASSMLISIKDPVPVTLSEENCLLMDIAEYSFDGGQWCQREELLRIDNKFREKLGYPLRMEAFAQPWVNQAEEKYEHTLSLKFTIESEISVSSPYLALENAGKVDIIANGRRVESRIEGWYVDECIKKVMLPDLPKGQSEIILNIPFNSRTNVEWCYLLGDFGVEVKGSHTRLTEPVRELAFGDWTRQGLPFYGGNVTYHCSIESEEGELVIEASHFRNPLLSAALNGVQQGKIAFAPYELSLGKVGKGTHMIDITAFGNRVNAFGAVHNCDNKTIWYGPNAWRTEGSSWSYEYQLRPTGILVSPRLSLYSL